jgi:protein-S-isoprenylcysteine O-methyltransferase Ste14
MPSRNFVYPHRGALTALLALALFLAPPAPFLRPGALTWIFSAFFLRVWARRYIGPHSRGSRIVCPEQVKDGPYAGFSHPLYLSNFLFAIGLAYFHLGFGTLLISYILAFGIFLAYLARQESRYIQKMNPPVQKKKPTSIWVAIKSDGWTWLWWTILMGAALMIQLH